MLSNQVKFRVRQYALMLQEFTVADIARLSKLNPESIRTEIQRMRKEALVISRREPRQKGQRGGSIAVYMLSEDPEAQLKLLKSVEAFSPIESITVAIPEQSQTAVAQSRFGEQIQISFDTISNDSPVAPPS